MPPPSQKLSGQRYAKNPRISLEELLPHVLLARVEGGLLVKVFLVKKKPSELVGLLAAIGYCN
jgi:hypothetical protein